MLSTHRSDPPEMLLDNNHWHHPVKYVANSSEVNVRSRVEGSPIIGELAGEAAHL